MLLSSLLKPIKKMKLPGRKSGRHVTTASTVLLSLGLLFILEESGAVPQMQRGSDYTVTHSDIRDALVTLVNVIHDLTGKLDRHELRERVLGEQLTKTLSLIEKRTRGEEKNFDNIGKFLVSLDEKIKGIKSAADKQADDARLSQDQIRREIAGLKQSVSSAASSTEKSDQSPALSRIESKLSSLEGKVELVSSGTERNTKKLDELNVKIKETASEAAAAAASAAAAVTSHNSAAVQSQSALGGSTALTASLLTPEISETLSEIKEALSRTADLETQILASKLLSGSETSESWQGELTESLDAQRRQLAQLEEEMGKTLGVLGDITTSASGLQSTLVQLETDTRTGFATIEGQVDALRSNTSEDLEIKLAKVQSILKSGQQHLESKVKEAETALDNLMFKMESGNEQLSRELKGLANVESVLLDTGDSVLDTKRRLEYGVQQIMGELGNQLSSYTSKLNDSLQQRFDGLATAVLGNQSIALTNLTSRMEGEISQVWRQIGILYHQVSRSATLLDEIHSQTSKYVNNSMDTMSSMDGKVGAITYRMGEVDDNLNYLLGRMSLVVQEFNMIKGGLGDALQSLKDSFAEISDADKSIKPTSNPLSPDDPIVTNEVKVPIPEAELQNIQTQQEET